MSADSTESPGAGRRPNIVLIVSDDHGYADRSALGTPGVSTPNMDRLADQGVTFTDAYVSAPICSPSRAAMMTGQYQQRWGATWFDNAELGDAPTIAEHLGAQGYATGYFGKVHYVSEGPGDRGCPPQHGFDESFYGLAGQSMGRLHYLTHSEQAVADYGTAATPMGVQPMWKGTDPVECDEFLTTAFADRAADSITKHQDEPFFAMVAFNAVHNFCWQLPADQLERRGLPAFEDWHPGSDEYLDWYDGAISPNLPNGREYYLAQLELMDQQVGELLERVESLGLTEDTIVVYLTDNGGSTCNYGNNAPLRGTKYTLWEGGIRVPMILRWPGVTEPGSMNNSLVSSLDLAATFAAAAGLASPAELDGQDLAGVIQGASGHEELHWDCGWEWAVRTDRWKLSWCDGQSETARQIVKVEHVSPGDGLFLADLQADPGEMYNLAEQRPDVVSELSRSHDRWCEDVGLLAPDLR